MGGTDARRQSISIGCLSARKLRSRPGCRSSSGRPCPGYWKTPKISGHGIYALSQGWFQAADIPPGKRLGAKPAGNCPHCFESDGPRDLARNSSGSKSISGRFPCEGANVAPP
jgi:hypothetical protein